MKFKVFLIASIFMSTAALARTSSSEDRMPGWLLGSPAQGPTPSDSYSAFLGKVSLEYAKITADPPINSSKADGDLLAAGIGAGYISSSETPFFVGMDMGVTQTNYSQKDGTALYNYKYKIKQTAPTSALKIAIQPSKGLWFGFAPRWTKNFAKNELTGDLLGKALNQTTSSRDESFSYQYGMEYHNNEILIGLTNEIAENGPDLNSKTSIPIRYEFSNGVFLGGRIDRNITPDAGKKEVEMEYGLEAGMQLESLAFAFNAFQSYGKGLDENSDSKKSKSTEFDASIAFGSYSGFRAKFRIGRVGTESIDYEGGVTDSTTDAAMITLALAQ